VQGLGVRQVGAANAFLIVVGIVGTVLGLLGAIAGALVYFGGSWRKSEMEMLRNSRTDLTGRVTELEAQRERDKVQLSQRDERIQHLTDMITSRQAYDDLVIQFEGMVGSLTTHYEKVDRQHQTIIQLIGDVAERLVPGPVK
jgi:hypothetical protein